MKSLSIRNIPDEIYEMLQNLAKANRRSMQEQIKLILENEVKLAKMSSLSKASEWRFRLKKRPLTDVVQSVREDRER